MAGEFDNTEMTERQEDHERNMESVQVLLQDCNMTVEAAYNGEEKTLFTVFG